MEPGLATHFVPYFLAIAMLGTVLYLWAWKRYHEREGGPPPWFKFVPALATSAALCAVMAVAYLERSVT